MRWANEFGRVSIRSGRGHGHQFQTRGARRGQGRHRRVPRRTDAVAHGKDHVEAVMKRAVFLAVGGSCQVFLDICLGP